MKRDYNIGDMITLRGRQYEVRPRSDYGPFEFCDHCALRDPKRRGRCNLRRCYSHFLLDCRYKSAYFKRV
jgi:hypothetical protein